MMEDNNTPGKILLAASIRPLPEPDLHEGMTLRDGKKYSGTEDGYTAATVLRLLSEERERCAKACEDEANRWRGEQDISDFRLCTALIRSGA